MPVEDKRKLRSDLTIFEVGAKSPRDFWLEVASLCPPLRPQHRHGTWAVDRLIQLTTHIKSVVLERNYICKDHRNLHSHYYSKKFEEKSSRCFRLHLFSSDVLKSKAKKSAIRQIVDANALLQKSYAGYLVVRPHGKRVLGRSALNPDFLGKTMERGYFALNATFKVHLSGCNFTVKAYPWMSQDTEAIVCAHASLWGVCRYLSQRYHIYKELYPYDFIELSSTARGRPVPYRGMMYSDYSEILHRFGCHPLVLNVENPSQDFEDIYSYVESGFPVLGSTGGHVITLMGHTLNLAQVPKPLANGMISSSEFVDAMLVSDDNTLPYQRLVRGTVDSGYTRTMSEIKHAVIPLPEKVFLPASAARSEAISLINDLASGPSGVHLRDLLDRKKLVIRHFATTGAALKAVAKTRLLSTKREIFERIIDLSMPHFVWVMELASLSGYRAGKCFGEIVLDATGSAYDLDTLLYLRWDNNLYLGYTEAFVSKKNVPECPQFRNNLGVTNNYRTAS